MSSLRDSRGGSGRRRGRRWAYQSEWRCSRSSWRPGGGFCVVSVALVVGATTGGIGRHVLTVVEGLAREQIRVDVYCPAATEAQFGFTGAGARVVPLEIVSGPGPRDVGRLRRGLRTDPVDVVHAHGLRAGFTAALARPNGVPLIVTWHSPALAKGVRRYARSTFARTVARAADVTLCASLEIQKEATDLGARDARLMMVVAPPLPAPVRRPAELREELGLPPDGPRGVERGRGQGKKQP